MPLLSKAIKAQPRVAVGQRRPVGPAIAGNRPAPRGAAAGVGQAKPVGGPAKASAVAAGTPPSSTPLPWDGAYEGSAANANLRYQNALAALGYKRGALQQEYGLDQGFNDFKANPYSRAALLEKSYLRAQRASANSLASSGQLYAGASQNAETYNREHDAQERDALEKVYRAALQDVGTQEAEAADRRNQEISEAAWRNVESAANAPLEPTAAPAGGGGGGKKPKGKAKVGISNARKAK